jgi:hypothetical protein
VAVDVDRLILLREPLYSALTSRPMYFRRPPEKMEQSRRLAELALLSSTTPYWSVFCCLAGFAGESPIPPRAVLHDLEYERLLGPGPEFESGWNSSKFLTYSAGHIWVSRQAFATAAYVLNLTLHPESLGTLKNAECIERCIENHRGDSDEIDECILGCPDA